MRIEVSSDSRRACLVGSSRSLSARSPRAGRAALLGRGRCLSPRVPPGKRGKQKRPPEGPNGGKACCSPRTARTRRRSAARHDAGPRGHDECDESTAGNGNACAHDVNPRAYLHKVVHCIVHGWLQANLRDLLPDRMLVAHPELYVGDPDALPLPAAAPALGR